MGKRSDRREPQQGAASTLVAPPVAVVAHRKKRLGDASLLDLRRALADRGVSEPAWFEVAKSKHAVKAARAARDAGAHLVLAWGGDGTVQRCVDALAGSEVALGVLPAGTANLLATGLELPTDLDGALDVALHGATRPLDVGCFAGEHFAVMAGVGFDARMVARVDRGQKDRFGTLAYVWAAATETAAPATPVRVAVDGVTWFEGPATCVLVGNVGRLVGGLEAFPRAAPDDGVLDVGVITADSRRAWARVLGRLLHGSPSRSPFVQMATAHDVEVEAEQPLPLELDGGERGTTRRATVSVRPGALRLRVPA